MPNVITHKRVTAVLEAEDLQHLLDALIGKGYQVCGPTLDSGAITYAHIRRVDDLPVGWTDQQEAGRYRVTKNKKKSYFAYAVGPHSWKKYLHPSAHRRFGAKRDGQSFVADEPEKEDVKRALVGVRPCELQAMAIHDKVFAGGPFVDRAYQQRRQKLFIVAVNCSHPSDTCFCASMNTGPKAESGFDILLTEVFSPTRHFFIVETGSQAGDGVLEKLPTGAVSDADMELAEKVNQQAVKRMKRSLNLDGIKEALEAKFDDPRWAQIAERCLACANCTMVCPTCFCTTMEDTTDLSGGQAERTAKWDSCFTLDFSYIHGGSIRSSGAARYRQWLMHKLVYWVDQFGTSGCVGCGRCITWCPAGIDITEEAGILRKKKFAMKLS